MLTMVAFVLGVKTFGSDVPLALALLAVAAVAGWAFVARARARLRAGREPLLDVELFAAPLFRVAALANATTMFAYTGLLFLLTQYLQLVAGLSPLHAGLLLVPGSVVTMVAGVGAARLARYAPFRVLVPVGLLLAASGYVVVLLLDGVGAAVAASVLIGAGIGLSETLTNDAILASAPPQRAGSASAVSETAYEVGAVLGTAVLGSVLGAAYARRSGRAHQHRPGVRPRGPGDPRRRGRARPTASAASKVSGWSTRRRRPSCTAPRWRRSSPRWPWSVSPPPWSSACAAADDEPRRTRAASVRSDLTDAALVCDEARVEGHRPFGGTTGWMGCAVWVLTGCVLAGCVLIPPSASFSWTSSEIWSARRCWRTRMSTSIEIP